MLIRYRDDFGKRFKSLFAMYPEANMKMDFESRITTLDFNFFVSGTFIDGKSFNNEKYGESKVFITNKDFFKGYGGYDKKYDELYHALYAINIPYTDYESEESQTRTVTVDSDDTIGFMTEIEINPLFQDHKISNVMFSMALRYLQRLHLNHILIKPYPKDIGKERYRGKKRDILRSINLLIEYYEKYAFEITVGDYDLEQPYMICCLDNVDVESARYKINQDFNVNGLY